MPLFKLTKIDKPLVDWNKPKETLSAIKGYILATAENEQNWYAKARALNGRTTRTLRFIALILFGMGLVLPLLNIEKVIILKHPINSLGYLCLATGGLILLFDKYFGLSSGFVRFYIAEEDIRKSIADFELAWETEIARAEFSNYSIESIVNILAIAKVLRQSISNTIQLETSAWAAEFQAQIGELHELLKQKASDYKRQLGSASVKIENYEGYGDIELILDEAVIKKLAGATSSIIRDVTLGVHQIQVRATKKGNPISFSQNFEVATDKTTEVTITLP